MSQERDLELMEQGSLAVNIAAATRDVVDNMIRTKFLRLLAIYRQGKIDHDQVVGLVAECAALEEFLSDLESMHRRAEGAANRELNSGKKV